MCLAWLTHCSAASLTLELELALAVLPGSWQSSFPSSLQLPSPSHGRTALGWVVATEALLLSAAGGPGWGQLSSRGGAGRAGLGDSSQAKSAAGPDPSAVTRKYPLPGGNNEVRAEGKNKPKGDGSRANTSVNNPVPQDHTLPGWDTGVAQGLTRYIHEAFW